MHKERIYIQRNMELIQMEIQWFSVVDYLEGLRLHFFHMISPPELRVMSGEAKTQQNPAYQTVTILSRHMIDTPASACLIKTPAIDDWWGEEILISG